MAAAAPALIGAKEAFRAGAKVLTGDLVVFRGQIHREREEVFYGPDLTPTGRLRKHTRKVLEPVDVELHVNPASIGLGLLAVGAAAVGISLAAWWAGLGVEIDPEIQDTIEANKATIRGLEGQLANLEGSIQTCIAQCNFLYAEARFRERRADCIAACQAGMPDVETQKAEIARLKGENRLLLRQLLKLETRPRFGENLFRIF